MKVHRFMSGVMDWVGDFDWFCNYCGRVVASVERANQLEGTPCPGGAS